jgi:YqjK-like protein
MNVNPMNERLIKLAERRAILVAKADSQRDLLEQTAASWRKPLALADQGLSAIHYLRQNPLLLAGTAVVVAVLRPRRILKWTQRGWIAWRLTRSLRRKLYGGGG